MNYDQYQDINEHNDLIRQQWESVEREITFRCDLCPATIMCTRAQAKRDGWQITERETFCARIHD